MTFCIVVTIDSKSLQQKKCIICWYIKKRGVYAADTKRKTTVRKLFIKFKKNETSLHDKKATCNKQFVLLTQFH